MRSEGTPPPVRKPPKRHWFRKTLLRLAVILVSAGAGAWIFSYFYAFPNSDLTQIEFPYSVEEVGGMPVVKIFFVTNRQVISEKDGTFSDADADHLSFGTALVRIPPHLRIGDLQLPEIPRGASDPNHPTVLEVDLLTKDKFYDALKGRLEDVEARKVNVFVHGINHTFDSSLRQAGALRFDLDTPQPIVLFAWSTESGILPGNYRDDEQRVHNASLALTEFLEEFQDNIHPRKINLIAHSLGCKVVCETFAELLTRSKWNDKETEMENVILASPDVDRGDFNKRFVQDVALLTDRVTVYVANNDGVLFLSSILNGQPRAGVRDDKEDISPEVENLVAKDARAEPHIEVIDATFVNNARSAHSYYYQSRPVFSDFYSLLRDNIPASQRHLLRYKDAGEANYWIIPP